MTVERLGRPETAETLHLRRRPRGTSGRHPGEAAGRCTTTGPVLDVHGFADYFFQTEYAEWWNARGYDFYALGPPQRRPLSSETTRPPNDVTDLREYYPELDEAWRRITVRDGDDHVRREAPTPPAGLPSRCGPRPAAAEATGLVPSLPGWTCSATVPGGGPSARQLLDQVGARLSDARAPTQRSAASTPGACTRTTRASGTSTSTGSRSGRGRCTRGGCGRSGAAMRAFIGVSTCPARSSCCRPAAVRTRSRWATTCIATTSCSTSRRSGAGRTAIGRHVTMVAVQDARQTSCCRCRRSRKGAYDEMDRWVSAYVD